MSDYTKNEHGVLVGKGGVTPAGWHSIEAFLRCPKEYQNKHIRKMKKPEAETKSPLATGLIMHAGKAVWFASNFQEGGNIWEKIRDAVKAEAESQKLPITAKDEQLGLKFVQEYIEHWRSKPKPKPLAVEHLVGPAPIADGDPFFLYRTARLDDVSAYAEAGYGLCIGETKTTSATATEVTKTYQLHGQPLLQHMLYRMAAEGQQLLGPVVGTMLDIIEKGYGKDKSKFSRVMVPVSEHAVKWYQDSMRHYLRLAAGVEWDSDVPRNISACTRTISGRSVVCDFRDLCQYGASTSGKYVLEGGKSLKDKAAWQGEKGPWE